MRTAILFCLLSAPLARAAAVEATWGLDLIDAIVKDKRNLVLPILECRLEGFVNDWAPYRTASVRRSAEGGRIQARVPSAGTFYPAFIFYDAAGDERIGLLINGVERGVAVASTDDNRQRLFFLSEPVTFQGGETFELRALTSQGAYRTEDLLLLRAKPQPRRHQYLIREVSAQPHATSATLAWITNWPAACTVEWTGGTVAEELPVANHRVVLSNLQPGRTYRFRLTAKTREGNAVSSEWSSFRTQAGAQVAGRVGKAQVPLKLDESALPLTAGLPFPKGALGSDAHLRLLDPQGRELPLQAQTLARWDDGSVKWALVDAQPASPSCTLEYGAQVRRRIAPSTLQVTEDGRAVRVSTGPLAFTVSKQRFGLFESVSLEGRALLSPEQPAALHLTGSDGVVYTSLGPPEEVAVEERGPVRAVVRVSGEHRAADGRKLFAYLVRIHAWAGQPYLRLQHTFVNNSPADFTSIRSLVLRLPLRAGPEQPGGFRAPRTEVRQHTDESPRAPGWAEWSDGVRRVTLAVRDFWQNYPKDLDVTPEGFQLGLCPPLRQDEYAASKGTVDEHRLFFYLQGGVYKLRQGVSKTHDIWLDLQPAAAPPSLLRAHRTPRFAAAPPEWYAASRAFGEMALPQPAGVVAQYDAAFARSFDGYLSNRETNREYGMLNFGDWWGERVINWGNSEYDTQHAFLLHFARTGDWRAFRAAEEMEWHNRDVDTVHAHSDKTAIGGVYSHSIGHTGDYYGEGAFGGRGIPAGHMSVDHTFIEGHLNYYFLTGDRRSLETARRTADRYDTYYTRNYDFSNCRQPGWHLTLTMAMYNATCEPFYLNAAKIIVERLLERQTPDGGWRRQLTVDHCQCVPRHHGNTGFMVGVLLTGLRHYYEATRDERVADSIVRAARFLIDDMWMPEAQAFRYTSCPKTRPSAGLNFLLFDGLVFAHQRTQDPRIRQVLEEGTPSALKAMGGWGKGFTQYTRVAPAFIGYLPSRRSQPD